MPTDNLGLNLQDDGTTNWDDKVEDNWHRIDWAVSLHGAGNPNGLIVGAFIGQRYYSYTDRIAYVCQRAGDEATALWIIDDGGYPGEIKMMVTSKQPPGWLSMNGQQVSAADYPALAAALAGTGVAIAAGVITLPDFSTNHMAFRGRNADSTLAGSFATPLNVNAGSSATILRPFVNFFIKAF